MRVLGIDVGFAITGWSIIDKDPMYKNGMKLVEYGAIITTADDQFEKRLAILQQDLDKIIKDFKPTHIAVESLFFFKNQKTIITVAQARGVILLTAQLNNLEIFNYTPLLFKRSITDYARAEKAQIQKMVKMVFGLKEAPKPDDVADAIAIGYCHVNTYRIIKTI